MGIALDPFATLLLAAALVAAAFWVFARVSADYRAHRNPHLAGSFVFIAGCALLWPSWTGALWASIWLVIAHWMARAEETHLERVYGDKYRAYCARTPRFLGLPRK
jgi:protein-S-isoprenylcysteine O-methyltransferase Ste14